MITYDTNVTNEYLLALNTLGKCLDHHTDNTSRRNNHDQGKMIVIGEGRRENGSYGVYSITNSTDDITTATSSVLNLAADYYTKLGFSTQIEAMQDKSGDRGIIDIILFVISIIQFNGFSEFRTY